MPGRLVREPTHHRGRLLDATRRGRQDHDRAAADDAADRGHPGAVERCSFRLVGRQPRTRVPADEHGTDGSSVAPPAARMSSASGHPVAIS